MVDRKDILSAKRTAEEILHLLRIAEKRLGSARNWGIYDMLGGGFFVSLIKRSKVADAENSFRQIRIKLAELQRQLKGFPLPGDPRVDISGFQWFLDIAFDHLIFDWFTQSKIKQSLREVAYVTSEVRKVISGLEDLERQHRQGLR